MDEWTDRDYKLSGECRQRALLNIRLKISHDKQPPHVHDQLSKMPGIQPSGRKGHVFLPQCQIHDR